MTSRPGRRACTRPSPRSRPPPDPDGSVADEALRARGRIQAGLGAAYMLDRRLDAAIAHAAEARTSAANSGDHATERHAATTLGVCYVFAGRMDDGWRLLDEVIESTRAEHLEVEAARAYRMIGSSASVLLDYPRATARLREGIEYAERVEAWNHRHYMSAHLAHVAWATGDWDLAERLAAASLADGRGGLTTRIDRAPRHRVPGHGARAVVGGPGRARGGEGAGHPDERAPASVAGRVGVGRSGPVGGAVRGGRPPRGGRAGRVGVGRGRRLPVPVRRDRDACPPRVGRPAGRAALACRLRAAPGPPDESPAP